MNFVMVGLVAFIQGTLDIVLLAYFYIYLYDHKASPCELAFFQAIAFLPWIAKPLFGLTSEYVKFLGYHKKSYIFAISLLEFTIHTLIFSRKFSKGIVLLCNVLQVACVCFRNAIGGSLTSLTSRIHTVDLDSASYPSRQSRRILETIRCLQTCHLLFRCQSIRIDYWCLAEYGIDEVLWQQRNLSFQLDTTFGNYGILQFLL